MNGVDHLANLLATVKSGGWDAAFEGDIMYGGHLSGDVENVKFHAYREPLRSMRHSIEDAKLCMAALNNIKARLAKKIRNLQKRCTPLVLEDGIERIPDELLAHIFEAGHKLSENSEFSLRVSHVSRRFRHVSLQTPSLWTRLSSEHPHDQTEAFLLRSGRVDLRVTLRGLSGNAVDKDMSSLRLLSSHSGRWSRLSLLMDHKMVEYVGLTHFPGLRSIYCHIDAERISSHWKMPLLSHFEGYCGDFPSYVSVPFVPFISQLTSVELNFDRCIYTDMTSFAQVLYGLSNLRKLSLEFRCCRAFQFASKLETPKPHSFHIDSLKVAIGDRMSTEFVTTLYNILEYFSASVIDVSLVMPRDSRRYLFPNSFPHASTIRVQRDPCYFPLDLNELVRNCEIVRSVHFETSYLFLYPDDELCTEWSDVPLTSLRHLRFHNCVMFEEEEVENMARTLIACEDFELLEIISCHKISEGFLMDLQDELGERLKWSF